MDLDSDCKSSWCCWIRATAFADFQSVALEFRRFPRAFYLLGAATNHAFQFVSIPPCRWHFTLARYLSKFSPSIFSNWSLQEEHDDLHLFPDLKEAVVVAFEFADELPLLTSPGLLNVFVSMPKQSYLAVVLCDGVQVVETGVFWQIELVEVVVSDTVCSAEWEWAMAEWSTTDDTILFEGACGPGQFDES